MNKNKIQKYSNINLFLKPKLSLLLQKYLPLIHYKKLMQIKKLTLQLPFFIFFLIYTMLKDKKFLKLKGKNLINLF
jgi:uncharacterized membrane protein